MAGSMEIYKQITIEAAHYLPYVGKDHKCSRMHGHSFVIKVFVSGSIDPKYGWVVDYGVIKESLNKVHKQLDHRCLNDIQGLENPTSENLAVWVWNVISPDLEGLSAVEIQETCTSGCIYRGEALE